MATPSKPRYQVFFQRMRVQNVPFKHESGQFERIFRPPLSSEKQWSGGGSNSQPRHCERRALPVELPPQEKNHRVFNPSESDGTHRKGGCLAGWVSRDGVYGLQ